MIEEYSVLVSTSQNIADAVEHLNELAATSIEEGWMPFGGICHTIDTGLLENDLHYRHIFSQAFVKYDNREINQSIEMIDNINEVTRRRIANIKPSLRREDA
jgi:hypothetical protein